MPGTCAVCHGWGRGRICASCIEHWDTPHPRCRGCAIDLDAARDPTGEWCRDCRADPPPFQRSVSALRYAYPWDGLVTDFKFHDGVDLAAAFAERLVASVRAARVDAVDLVVPVPLSGRRLRERGYNQAWELARRSAAALRLAADARLLRRPAEGAPLSRLARGDRLRRIRAAFEIAEGDRPRLQGRRVALVDDVMTTTATAREAASTLLDAGAASVQVWVLARTPRD